MIITIVEKMKYPTYTASKVETDIDSQQQVLFKSSIFLWVEIA